MTRRLPRARDNHPGQRHDDSDGAHPSWWRRVFLWSRRYVLPATLWSFVASVVAVWALLLHYNDQGAILQGRRTAIAVTCGATNGVITAGRQIVLGPTDPKTPVTPFERNLEALGYPPRRVRRSQAKQAADLYTAQIAQSVRNVAGGHATDLVKPDGTLDCARLQIIAHAR